MEHAESNFRLGLPAFYPPDFLVRASGAIYMVETKAQGPFTNPDVLRKRKAAVAWCDRINALAAEQLSGAERHCALLGESAFYGWRDKGGSIADLLSLCATPSCSGQGASQIGVLKEGDT